MHCKRSLLLLPLLFLSCLSHALADASPRYTLTLMDALGGAESRAWAVDNAGTVVGMAETKTPFTQHAVTMWQGRLKDIGAGLNSDYS